MPRLPVTPKMATLKKVSRDSLSMRRPARVEGWHIVLEASMTEAKMRDLAYANTAYRKFVAAQQRQEGKEAKTAKTNAAWRGTCGRSCLGEKGRVNHE